MKLVSFLAQAISEFRPRSGQRVQLADLHWSKGYIEAERGIREVADYFGLEVGRFHFSGSDRPRFLAVKRKRFFDLCSQTPM